MKRARPVSVETPRLEIMPLVDVIFLLLTFFVFALALMVRAELLDVRLAELASAERATQGAAVSIAVLADGSVRVNGESADVEAMLERTLATRSASPEAPIFVAADEGAPAGALLRVMDALVGAGLDDFSLVGRPAAESAPPAQESANEPPSR